MNNLQIRRALALKHVSMLPGSWDKKFAASMIKKAEAWERGERFPDLSENQHMTLARVCYKYRRQISAGVHPRRDPKMYTKEIIQAEMQSD